MNYVTTNIRIPEKDYLKLKAEAAKKRKSLAAIIRDKITEPDETENQPQGTLALLKLAELAEKNNWAGPEDLAENHNKYFAEAWEATKGKKEKK